MPPEMITTVMPTAMMAMKLVSLASWVRLCALKNLFFSTKAGTCSPASLVTYTRSRVPSAPIENTGCRTVPLTVANSQSLFTSGYSEGQRINVPVAHHDGNYFADAETLDRLEGEGRVAFRYAENCNGSARDIAGVLNNAGNVLGMMPHPERAMEPAHGGSDGRTLFESAIKALVGA